MFCLSSPITTSLSWVMSLWRIKVMTVLLQNQYLKGMYFPLGIPLARLWQMLEMSNVRIFFYLLPSYIWLEWVLCVKLNWYADCSWPLRCWGKCLPWSTCSDTICFFIWYSWHVSCIFFLKSCLLSFFLCSSLFLFLLEIYPVEVLIQ